MCTQGLIYIWWPTLHQDGGDNRCRWPLLFLEKLTWWAILRRKNNNKGKKTPPGLSRKKKRHFVHSQSFVLKGLVQNHTSVAIFGFVSTIMWRNSLSFSVMSSKYPCRSPPPLLSVLSRLGIGLSGIVRLVDELWPERRGNEKSACYGPVMVYSTLDVGPLGLLCSWPYTLLHISVHPPLWLLTPSYSGNPPPTPSIHPDA